MCGVCGCGGEGAKIEGAHPKADQHDHDPGHAHSHVLADGTVVTHSHPQSHPHSHTHGPSDGHDNATSKARLVKVERDLLERNDAAARHNRSHFAAHRLLVLNLVSSPGSGKTTLLVETIARLQGTRLGVIEGDQQTSLDAERIRAAGAPAVQINTGKGCHLEADQVAQAFDRLHDLEDGVLFIENVGILVCPAIFDLGETHRVVIASVTEGDDKPLKYPDMFASADLMIVSKSDLADACGSDVDTLIANARKVRPGLPALVLSARTGAGLDRWLAWIAGARAMLAATG
jgi:hydrogenase nickel incorporation protein HypB